MSSVSVPVSDPELGSVVPSVVVFPVDVPIVVRDQHRDQQPLLQYVPGAYVTTATGAAGWLDAVIGPAV